MRKRKLKETAVKLLSYWYPVTAGILLFLLMVQHFGERLPAEDEEEAEFDAAAYTHLLPHSYVYPEELGKIRRLVHAETWNTACAEIEKYPVAELPEAARPVFYYLRGRVFRMLFEEDANKEYAPNGRLSDTCAASEFLAEAMNSYRMVADQYPGHFLADDAFGWLGGCAFRSGNYVQALDLYLQLLGKYPRSDITLRYITNDIAFSISQVLRLWQEISRPDQERFLELLRLSNIFGEASAPPPHTNIGLPKAVWSTLARSDIQRLLDVLRKTGRLESFVHSSGGVCQIAHSLPLLEVPVPQAGTVPVGEELSREQSEEQEEQQWEEQEEQQWEEQEGQQREASKARVSPYLDKLVSKLYYSGRFEETRRVLDTAWPYLPDKTKEELLAYYWCSAVNSMSPRAALQFATGRDLRQAVAAIAYDFTNLEELRDLCRKRMGSFGDVLDIILADRLAAAGDNRGAVQQLLEMPVAYPDSLYVDTAYLQVLRLTYFLALNGSQAEWTGPLIFRPPGSEEYLALFRSFETSFFGDEFAQKNRELLDDLYRQNRALAYFIWGWPQNFFSHKSIRSDFVTRAGRLLLRIRARPDFDRIPPSSQRVILDLLEFSNSSNDLIRPKYTYEESLFRETLVPYMRARRIRGIQDFEEQVLPLLGWLWNIMNVGKFEPATDSMSEYQLRLKCDYLLNSEQIFRTIRISNDDWNNEAYLLAYRLRHKRGLPLLVGSNYELASRSLQEMADTKTLSRHLQPAYLDCLACLDNYAAQTLSVHQTWLSVLLHVSRANLRVEMDVSDLLECHDLSCWDQEWRQIKNMLPLQYADFLAKCRESGRSMEVARRMADAYADLGNTGLAHRIREKWGVKESSGGNHASASRRLGAQAGALETSGEIVALKAAAALVLGEYDTALKLTNPLYRKAPFPHRAASLYTRARSYLGVNRTREGLECLLEYLRQYPSADEVPLVVADIVKAVHSSREDCTAVVNAIGRELDSLANQMACLMNIYFVLYARFELSLGAGESETALKTAEKLILEDYPTRNLCQIHNELASHPLLLGIRGGRVIECLHTRVPCKRFFYYRGTLHSVVTETISTSAGNNRTQ